MDKLPPELVSMVFDHVDGRERICAVDPISGGAVHFRKALANTFSLRLVSKKFAEIGARNIVETVHLVYRKQSFQNLENISNHPELRKYVKCIVYESDILVPLPRKMWEISIPLPRNVVVPPYAFNPAREEVDDDDESIIDYRRRYRRAEMKWRFKHGPRILYTEKELAEGYDCFKREVKDIQSQVFDVNLDYITLAETFTRLPNLSRIENLVGMLYNSEALNAAFKHTLVSPSLLQLRQRQIDIGSRQVESLLLAIGSSGVKLKTLSLTQLGWNFFSGRRTVDLSWVSRTPCLPAFMHLEHLEISLDVPRTTLKDELSIQTRQALLGKAISSARGLTSLDLSFNIITLTCHSVLWDTIASQTNWPHLKELGLSSLAMTENFWIDFLRRHSKTLVTLRLSDIAFLNVARMSTFAKMAEVIEKTNVLKAIELTEKFVCVEGPDSSESGSMVIYMDGCINIDLGPKFADYLLGNGEDPALLFYDDSYKDAVLFFDVADLPNQDSDDDSDDAIDDANDDANDSEIFEPPNFQDSHESDHAANPANIDLHHDYLHTEDINDPDDFTNFADFGEADDADDSDDPDYPFPYYRYPLNYHIQLPAAESSLSPCSGE